MKTILKEAAPGQTGESYGICGVCRGSGQVEIHQGKMSERSALSESADPAMENFLGRRLNS